MKKLEALKSGNIILSIEQLKNVKGGGGSGSGG